MDYDGLQTVIRIDNGEEWKVCRPDADYPIAIDWALARLMMNLVQARVGYVRPV